MKKISILGCGWLGFPLAKSLLKKGYIVQGSTTSEAKKELLKSNGITPFVISLPDHLEELPQLLESDILVLNIPPGTKRDPSGKAFLATINLLITYINNSNIKHLIYASSTSVYNSDKQIVKEQYVRSESPLKTAEELLISSLKIPVTVLRLGGLVGPDRTLLRFFSGKEKTGGNIPVNYVYRDDVIAAIQTVLTQPKAGTFNICADLHPTKNEFYTTHCERKEIPLPHFIKDEPDWKIIDNELFKTTFDFRYTYPDPLTFPL